MSDQSQGRAGLQDRTPEELIASALAAANDDAEYWTAVYELQDRGTQEVFDAACALCQSNQPKERALGADILGQGQSSTKTFRDDAVRVLLHALEQEQDPHLLSSLVCALGHQHDVRAIGPVARLRDHPDDSVRWAVVFGLLGYEDPLAIQTLIILSEDRDSDVRDWAT